MARGIWDPGWVTDPHPPIVAPLRPEERTRAADLLGRAFTDDPLWAAIMPEDGTRTPKLTQMIEVSAALEVAVDCAG